MLGITFSPQNYHHHQQFLSKLREINENVMTSAVWAVIVFGPRVWQLSARCHYVLRGFSFRNRVYIEQVRSRSAVLYELVN